MPDDLSRMIAVFVKLVIIWWPVAAFALIAYLGDLFANRRRPR